MESAGNEHSLAVCFWNEKSRFLASSFLMLLGFLSILASFFGTVLASYELKSSLPKFHSRMMREFVKLVERGSNISKSDMPEVLKNNLKRIQSINGGSKGDNEDDFIDEITQTRAVLIILIIISPVECAFYLASFLLSFKLNVERERKHLLNLVKIWIIIAAIHFIFCLAIDIWIAISSSDDDTKTMLDISMQSLMHKYSSSKKSRKLINRIHSKHKCCGWKGFENWIHFGKNQDTPESLHYSIPLSCCNPDSSLSCKYENLPKAKKKITWIKAIHSRGCSAPLLENLRTSVKLAILIAVNTKLPLIICQTSLYRYFWTNIENLDEEELNENTKTIAYLMNYPEQGSNNGATLEDLKSDENSPFLDSFQKEGKSDYKSTFKKTKTEKNKMFKSLGKKGPKNVKAVKGSKLAGFLKKIKK
ncbi:MAG: hypothetical protein MHPSP_001035 [Paramarteilia canceri]